MAFVRVPGRRPLPKKVVLFALSTCGWCRRTKELLNEVEIEYEYVDVDQCSGEERETITAMARRLNPRGNYPILQIGDQVVVGYDPERIRKALGE